MSINSSHKTGCNQFLTNRDLFANQISLTYNQQKKYQTAYGGVMTIFSGLVLLIWFVSNMLTVAQINYNFQTFTSLKNSEGTSLYEQFPMQANDFILAFNFIQKYRIIPIMIRTLNVLKYLNNAPNLRIKSNLNCSSGFESRKPVYSPFPTISNGGLKTGLSASWTQNLTNFDRSFGCLSS